jgi:hypothetical protein
MLKTSINISQKKDGRAKVVRVLLRYGQKVSLGGFAWLIIFCYLGYCPLTIWGSGMPYLAHL